MKPLSPLTRINMIRELKIQDPRGAMAAKALLFAIASMAHADHFIPDDGPYRGYRLPATCTWASVATLGSYAGLGATVARETVRRLHRAKLVRVEHHNGKPPLVALDDDALRRHVDLSKKRGERVLAVLKLETRGAWECTCSTCIANASRDVTVERNAEGQRSPVATPTLTGGVGHRSASEGAPPSVAKGAQGRGSPKEQKEGAQSAPAARRTGSIHLEDEHHALLNHPDTVVRSFWEKKLSKTNAITPPAAPEEESPRKRVAHA